MQIASHKMHTILSMRVQANRMLWKTATGIVHKILHVILGNFTKCNY